MFNLSRLETFSMMVLLPRVHCVSVMTFCSRRYSFSLWDKSLLSISKTAAKTRRETPASLQKCENTMKGLMKSSCFFRTWILPLKGRDSQVLADLLLQHVVLSCVIWRPFVLCQVFRWEIRQPGRRLEGWF